MIQEGSVVILFSNEYCIFETKQTEEILIKGQKRRIYTYTSLHSHIH